MRANTKLTKNLSAAENWLFCTRAATNVRTRADASPYTTHGWRLSLCTAGVAVSTVIGWYYAALSTRAAGYPRVPSGIARAPDGEPTEQRMRAGRQALE